MDSYRGNSEEKRELTSYSPQLLLLWC